MQVSTGMSSMVVTVSPGLTLHDAARAMSERKVGAAVVIDPEQPGPGIITERDVLQSVGKGQDPNSERVSLRNLHGAAGPRRRGPAPLPGTEDVARSRSRKRRALRDYLLRSFLLNKYW